MYDPKACTAAVTQVSPNSSNPSKQPPPRLQNVWAGSILHRPVLDPLGTHSLQPVSPQSMF